MRGGNQIRVGNAIAGTVSSASDGASRLNPGFEFHTFYIRTLIISNGCWDRSVVGKNVPW